MDKFLENIQEAQHIVQTVDHLLYVTFPLIKEKKILIKIVIELKDAVTKCINSILQYEYIYKRVSLYKDPRTNYETFKKCSKWYGISEKEIKSIEDLFRIVERHKQSSMEFVKNGKIVILSDDMAHEIITEEKAKEFLALSKSLLLKLKNRIST
jgi:hypothetical protein